MTACGRGLNPVPTTGNGSLRSKSFKNLFQNLSKIINYLYMNTEIWHKCEVPYTRYEVSNLGRVRNARTGLVLRPRKHNWGYQQVALFYKGQRKDCYIHDLVATAFVEGWREGLEVNHKNGVKTDNRAENLEWVSSSENHRHARDVLLLEVKPVALLDERGHLQRLFNSSNACDRAMGGNVHVHIYRKCRFHGYRPLYISVPMYREIVHLVAVQHYTLHSAWVEANTNLFLRNNDENY